MQIQTSDLFIKRGSTFNWNERIADQNKLIARLKELNNNAANKYADELEKFTNDGIASMVFIEYIVDKLKASGFEIQ